MKILILGASGMLGHTLLGYFYDNNFDVKGTVRSISKFPEKFLKKHKNNIIDGVDVFDFSNLEKIILNEKPDVIINAVGIIKQKKDNYVNNIYINALLPHKIAELCEINNIRFITVATDCVFKGDLPENEMYTEQSLSDCVDLYGKSKFLGEVIDKKNTLTLRTSIIGHELGSNFSLIDWFLSQENEVNGFTRAFYSGFPTIVFAKILHNVIENHKDLNGLHQISSDKISKYDLLQLVNKVYNKNIRINKNNDFYMNRVLDSINTRKTLNITIPTWEEMILEMYKNYRHI